MPAYKEKNSVAVNIPQQEAIHFTEGTMLVLAGPGSGKTYVITQRIKYLIEEVKISPGQILVITFTKAAALEMKNRCIQICKGASEAVFGTFHSVFYQILRTSRKYQNYTLITNYQKTSIMKQILSCYDYDNAQILSLSEKYLAEISLRKNTGGLQQKTADNSKRNSRIQESSYVDNEEENRSLEIMQKYQEECEVRELLDFDDMLLLCHKLFIENPAEREKWQSRFQYLLVDEFQDVNSIQYEMTRLLSATHGNLFVVGDDDQAIYAFRGSNPAYMRQFLEDYPDCSQVLLAVNYRCGDQIIEAAKKCIANNKNRFSKDITAGTEKENAVQIKSFATKLEEVDFICRKIVEKKQEEVAILLRTNSKAEIFAEHLYSMKIPYQMKEKRKCFYDQPIVMDFLSILRFVFMGRSRRDFLVFMNKPVRYISRDKVPEAKVDFDRLKARYQGKIGIYDSICRLEKDLEFLQDMDAYGCISFIIYGMQYHSYLTEKYAGDAEKLAEANEIIEQLKERSREFHTALAFLNFIEEYRRSFTESEKKAENTNAKAMIASHAEDNQAVVQLMTYHGSKGLEFDTVFLPGINRGQVPHGRMLSQEALEEERRMFYVAMTRAKNQLYITCVSDTQAKEDTRSVFLTELEEK